VSSQSRTAAFAPRHERTVPWPSGLRPGHPGPTSACRQLDPRAVRHRCISGSSRRSSRKLQGPRPRASPARRDRPRELDAAPAAPPVPSPPPTVLLLLDALLLLLAALLLHVIPDAVKSPAAHPQDLAPETTSGVQSVTPPCRRAIAGNGTRRVALRFA
jgi:hypothetical protein